MGWLEGELVVLEVVVVVVGLAGLEGWELGRLEELVLRELVLREQVQGQEGLALGEQE